MKTNNPSKEIIDSNESKNPKSDDNKEYPGYPSYPESEDIFNHSTEEPDLDPEDISKKKTLNEKQRTPNEKDFTDVKTGIDLDIPGAELDDEQESVGSEDEENNYYSIGGDDHDDLEEDKGD